MKIVTTGWPFLDIDGYGGCVAYAEFLQASGQEAAAVSTAPFNESISRTVRSWHAPLQTEYSPSDNDTFVLIDLSEPEYFDKIVDLDRIDEVIDHHLGFEDYWRERIGDGTDIEFIGAACTMVYERWKKASLLDKMSATSARLLVCGILDNTLNFGAKVTTQRDIDAHTALLSRADLPDDWAARYFTECQETILNDAVAAIQNDTKKLQFKTYGGFLRVGQLAVWDGKEVLAEHERALRSALASTGADWFINLISIGERKNYFITDNTAVQVWLTKLFNVRFEGSVATTDRLWLRKEIMKQDIDAS